MYSVDLSADARLVATGDQHKQAMVFDVETGGLMLRMDCGEVVKKVDFSADATVLATGAGGSCLVWDVASGSLVEKRESGGRVKLAPDAASLVSIDASGRASLRRCAV